MRQIIDLHFLLLFLNCFNLYDKKELEIKYSIQNLGDDIIFKVMLKIYLLII